MNKGLLFGLVLLFGASMLLVSSMPVLAYENMEQGAACPFDRSWDLAYRPTGGGLIGALVLDRNGEDLGRVVDVTTGSGASETAAGAMVNFIIVSSCLSGMGDRLVAIPYTATDGIVKVKTVTLAMSMEDFNNAPTLYTSEWPNSVHYGWQREAYNYWEGTEYF